MSVGGTTMAMVVLVVVVVVCGGSGGFWWHSIAANASLTFEITASQSASGIFDNGPWQTPATAAFLTILHTNGGSASTDAVLSISGTTMAANASTLFETTASQSASGKFDNGPWQTPATA